MKLSFYCDQTIDDFEKTPNEYHCVACKKTLVDFTQFTPKEIEVYHQQHNNVCGIYRSEHVIEHLITPIDLNSFWIKTIGASLVAFFSFLKPISAQKIVYDTIITEIINDSSTVENSCESELHIVENNKNLSPSSNINYKKRRRFYLSSRLPFIHYGRHYMTGVLCYPDNWKLIK